MPKPRSRPTKRRAGFLTCFCAALALSATPTFGEEATYRLTVDNSWSDVTHPGNFPPQAHFSWIGGGSHTSAVSFWDTGVVASPAIVQMAEFGFTGLLTTAVQDAITAGTADAVLNWPHWFCPADITNVNCGPMTVEFTIDSAFPLVTLVSMIGPSPDWFIGVSGLPLHDGNQWHDLVIVDLRPYDAGSRDQNLFALGGPATTPPAPITPITTASGQLIGPASLGSFRFERIDVSFRRGDVNADGTLNLLDAVTILGALFGGGAAPDCGDSADVNDDGNVDLSDPIAALGYLFASAAAPPAPFPNCGADIGVDTIRCSSYSGCP